MATMQCVANRCAACYTTHALAAAERWVPRWRMLGGAAPAHECGGAVQEGQHLQGLHHAQELVVSVVVQRAGQLGHRQRQPVQAQPCHVLHKGRPQVQVLLRASATSGAQLRRSWPSQQPERPTWAWHCPGPGHGALSLRSLEPSASALLDALRVRLHHMTLG